MGGSKLERANSEHTNLCAYRCYTHTKLLCVCVCVRAHTCVYVQVNDLLILDSADDRKAKYEALDQWCVCLACALRVPVSVTLAACTNSRVRLYFAYTCTLSASTFILTHTCTLSRSLLCAPSLSRLRSTPPSYTHRRDKLAALQVTIINKVGLT
jgi:hypothetical protein